MHAPSIPPMSDAHPVRHRPARPVPALALLAVLAAACADAVTTPGARQAAAVPGAALAADAADPCNGVAPTALTPGQAITVADSSLCVAGGAEGAEYALVPVNGSTSARRSTLVSVTPTGVVNASDVGPVAPVSSADLLRAGAARASLARSEFAASLEARRLAAGRALVRPRIGAARRWQAARARRRAAGLRAADHEPLAVGQVIQINTNTDDACEGPTPTPARVVALSKSAVVVADEANPAEGFTDADYQRFAAVFDSVIDPVDRKNFGDPTDIDENGRTILFFSRAVNALSEPGGRTFVAGFFWVRDLLPNAKAEGVPEDWVCPGSNAGEMFYLMVPDPHGDVNGNRFEKPEVESLVISTIGHEYEHLINASRRVYIIEAAQELEDIWLDEGLAHAAEELIFYARTGLSPRANTDAAGLRGTPGYLDLFTTDALDNFRNLSRFLASPSTNSPYAENGRLETRGAMWSFLRFATDHRGGEESETWQALVNTGPIGQENLRAVFGADVPRLFRDWSTSLLVDDLAGADARFQQRSWNFPSVYGVVDETSPYPLRTVRMADGVISTVRVTAGGSAYLRFGVAAGATASLRWDALPAGTTMTAVRLR